MSKCNWPFLFLSGVAVGVGLSRLWKKRLEGKKINSEESILKTSTTSQLQDQGGELKIEKVMTEFLPAIDETLKTWVPKKLTPELLQTRLNASVVGLPGAQWDSEQMTKSISEPIWEMLDRGGKRWRSTLMILIAQALGQPLSLDFVAITEIIHNGTLVLDDIEDDSEYRRNKPCLHKLIGIDNAANVGNTMYFLPLVVLKHWASRLPAETLVACYEIVVEEMLSVHFGQGLDIGWHSPLPNVSQTSTNISQTSTNISQTSTNISQTSTNISQTSNVSQNSKNSFYSTIRRKGEPTVGQYLQMCACKTGALARMSARLAAVLCGATPEQSQALSEFAEGVGVAFQIQDDLLNISQSAVSQSKGGLGEDIHEGKRTLMVIHALEHLESKDALRLQEILSLKTMEPKLVGEAIQLMKKSNSIEFAQEKMLSIVHHAWERVEKCLPDSRAKQKLKMFAEFLVERKN